MGSPMFKPADAPVRESSGLPHTKDRAVAGNNVMPCIHNADIDEISLFPSWRKIPKEALSLSKQKGITAVLEDSEAPSEGGHDENANGWGAQGHQERTWTRVAAGTTTLAGIESAAANHRVSMQLHIHETRCADAGVRGTIEERCSRPGTSLTTPSTSKRPVPTDCKSASYDLAICSEESRSMLTEQMLHPQASKDLVRRPRPSLECITAPHTISLSTSLARLGSLEIAANSDISEAASTPSNCLPTCETKMRTAAERRRLPLQRNGPHKWERKQERTRIVVQTSRAGAKAWSPERDGWGISEPASRQSIACGHPKERPQPRLQPADSCINRWKEERADAKEKDKPIEPYKVKREYLSDIASKLMPSSLSVSEIGDAAAVDNGADGGRKNNSLHILWLAVVVSRHVPQQTTRFSLARCKRAQAEEAKENIPRPVPTCIDYVQMQTRTPSYVLEMRVLLALACLRVFAQLAGAYQGSPPPAVWLWMPMMSHIYCSFLLKQLSSMYFRRLLFTSRAAPISYVDKPVSRIIEYTCYQVKCGTCGKPTWAGCGQHIEQALEDVKEEDRETVEGRMEEC
ncbi:hypothetical protein FISHEDRAFT_62385 [Fistulina hepatica ATCC 64428]|nr:hypothetical protein FISHEDRAFT_62385 [Fistulina hepatica ATCC 64428]